MKYLNNIASCKKIVLPEGFYPASRFFRQLQTGFRPETCRNGSLLDFCKSLNNKGIALITSLMFTLISLTIVMALLYMVTQSTKVSGANKRYKTTLEASYGGAELFTKDILPYLMQNYGSSTLAESSASTFSAVNLQIVSTQNCLQSKLILPSGKWPAGCSNTSSPKQNPDMTFNLLSATASPYTIYSKIVETVLGNTDVSGLQLEGAGVAEGSSGITPQHFPYLYRLEIQGEQSTASSAQANIEVLYAY